MIGLFGGSFNPPHRGHLEFVRYALEQKKADQVWVIPCFEHPFGKKLAPFEDRLQMCRLQFGVFGPRVKISEVERELGGKSYSLKAVRTLKQRHRKTDFSLLVGADIVPQMSQWHRSKALLNEVELLVVPRGKHSPIFDVSASEIRKKITQGEDLKTILTAEVWDYIKEAQLYKGEGDL